MRFCSAAVFRLNDYLSKLLIRSLRVCFNVIMQDLTQFVQDLTPFVHRCISSIQGGHGFYVPAYLGLLPRRAWDMLTVRFGQLTVGGLSPPKIRSLAGYSQTPSRLGSQPWIKLKGSG